MGDVVHVAVRAGRDRREADGRQRRETSRRRARRCRAPAGSGSPACRRLRTSTASGRRSRSGRPAWWHAHPARASADRRDDRARGAQARAEQRHGERFEVAEHRHERERGADQRGDAEQRRRAAARAAAPERSGDERRGAERSAAPRRRAPPTASSHCQNAKPIATATAAATTAAGTTRRSAPPARDAERVAEAGQDSDRVPGPHLRPSVGRRLSPGAGRSRRA